MQLHSTTGKVPNAVPTLREDWSGSVFHGKMSQKGFWAAGGLFSSTILFL